MAPTEKVISVKTAMRRINRKMAIRGGAVRTARGPTHRAAVGRYYLEWVVEDVTENMLKVAVVKDVDPRFLAESFRVLKPGEVIR